MECRAEQQCAAAGAELVEASTGDGVVGALLAVVFGLRVHMLA